MTTFKPIPLIIIAIGTLGLLAVELFVDSGSRYLTLTFAGLNVIGLISLFSTCHCKKDEHEGHQHEEHQHEEHQ